MSRQVRITDVAPRDGLQNEPNPIPANDKIELAARLADSGVDEVEVSSFVSARWIPQLGDAAEVFAGLAERKPAGVIFSALVPNEMGMRAALAVNEKARATMTGASGPLIDKIAVFTSASETFAQRNTNASIAQTLERFAPVLDMAREAGLATRGYISCVVQCPFEGPIAPAAVMDVAERLLALGVEELDLGDTIGAATPDTTARLLEAMKAGLSVSAFDRLTLHLHDTFGNAGESVRAALEIGVRSFDGAVGGLGGCPYASTPGRRAPGNLDTCALLAVVERMGFTTNVDKTRLQSAAEYAARILGRS